MRLANELFGSERNSGDGVPTLSRRAGRRQPKVGQRTHKPFFHLLPFALERWSASSIVSNKQVWRPQRGRVSAENVPHQNFCVLLPSSTSWLSR